MHICVFGLGEAGSEIAAGLVGAGVSVSAFDPAPVGTPDGVMRFATPAAAVSDVEVVIALTAAADATVALEQALHAIPDAALYADFSTAAPARKRELHGLASSVDISLTDVALMGTVPGKGLGTPSLASGPDAVALADTLIPLGMRIEVVGDSVGVAATHKLLRSVAIKGLAAVVVESMAAAEAAGLDAETWANLVAQFTSADEAFLRRIIAGTARHAERRLHEMEAAMALLEELGVDPVMTRATVENLGRIVGGGQGRATPGSGFATRS